MRVSIVDVAGKRENAHTVEQTGVSTNRYRTYQLIYEQTQINLHEED